MAIKKQKKSKSRKLTEQEKAVKKIEAIKNMPDDKLEKLDKFLNEKVQEAYMNNTNVDTEVGELFLHYIIAMNEGML